MRLYEIENKKGSYAGVTFDQSTVQALLEYLELIDLPTQTDSDDFHTTLMYSTKYIPNFKPLGDIQWRGNWTGFEKFDDGNVLVLTYDCKELSDRWQDIKDEYGAEWDFPEYIPHITLTYDGADIDLSSLPDYHGPIIIINEYSEDLDPDYKDNE